MTAPAVEWGLLCSIDSRRYFTSLGEGWEDALGWTREELLSRPFTGFVHPAERDATLASMAAAWQGDSAAIALETRFRMRGGRWHLLRWSPSPDRAELAATAGRSSRPERPRGRSRPVVRAVLRGMVVTASVCAAIGLAFLLTSFVPADTGNPPLSATSGVPVGMDGPITGFGPTVRAWDGTAPPPGLLGAPLRH